MQRSPTPLDHFDVEEVDDIAFRFGKHMRPGETIANVDVDCRSVGTQVVDPTPANVVAVPHSVAGTDVVQRVQSLLLGARYVIRVRATMSSGRVFVGAASVAVVRQ